MTYPTRLKLNGITVVALVISLLLAAVAFPIPVAATPAIPSIPSGGTENPAGAQGPEDGMDNTGNGMDNTGNGDTGNGDTGNGDTGNGNGNGTVDPGPGNGTGGPVIPLVPEEDEEDNGTMAGPHASVLSNRIVLHVATPVQLVKAGDGLQFFYIGADGSTVSGPVFASFSELAEMHASGAWVPLLDAVNPLTGKQVNVDYIPNEQKIRVFTYYPDKGQDVNKQYIFNFGSDYSINVEAW